jgi:hypothetical protein
MIAQPGGDSLPALFVDEKELSPGTGFEWGQPDDAGLVLHTSGTTSRPKQVPLLQRNLMPGQDVAAHRLGDDVSFRVMPLFHVHGLASTLRQGHGDPGNACRGGSPRSGSGSGRRERGPADLVVGRADAA